MTWVSYGMATRLVSKLLLPYLHRGFVKHPLLQYPDANSDYWSPRMGTENRGVCVLLGLRGTAGESEMCLDLNNSWEQRSSSKQQQQPPAMERMTHLTLRYCTSHSPMRHQNMPKKERETWLSKTTTRVGTSIRTAKAFQLKSAL